MPGRRGRSVTGGWAQGGSANGLPANASYDRREGNEPSEYKATQTIEFLPGFESGSGDAFETFLTSDNSGSTNGSLADNGGGYRYGFNGKENDNDVEGEGNAQDYGMRIYDTRVGRFLSVDPLTKDYPWYTPYQFAGNSPIDNLDLDGQEDYNYKLVIVQQNGKTKLQIEHTGTDDGWLAGNSWQIDVSALGVSEASKGFPIDLTIKFDRVDFQSEADFTTAKKVFESGSVEQGKQTVRKLIFAERENTTKVILSTIALEALEGVNNYVNAKVGQSKVTAPISEQVTKANNGNANAAKSNTAILGEANNSQAGQVFNTVKGGTLPGSGGAYLGGSRLSQPQMQTLTDLHNVEFAQVYTAGSGKNGGGGFYTLYSGTRNSVNVPVAPNSFLIDHTHPGGTTSPSIFDINYLLKSQQAGSPQQSSTIIPSGSAPVRFNKNTPANGKE